MTQLTMMQRQLRAAHNTLVKDAEFLGLTLDELLQDMRKDTGSYPLLVVEAFKRYEQLAYI